MKIRTFIYLSLLLLAGVIVVFSILMFISAKTIDQARQKHANTNAIAKNITEVRALTFEYILSPGERAKKQWLIVYENLTKLLQNYRGSSEEEQSLLAEINLSHKRLKEIFDQLINATENNVNLTEPQLTNEIQRRLIGQLLTQSQVMVTNALKLSEITYKQTISTQSTTNQLTIILMSLLFLSVLILLFLFKRRILKPLSELEKATEIISHGNLDYKVPIFRMDEIGFLSQSFNNMTEKLKGLDLMKTEFLKIAAHQLRTPLGVMRWSLEEVMGDRNLNPEKEKERLVQIYQAVTRLISLIGELLIVYRIDKGEDSQSKGNLKVNENIKRNIEKIKAEAKDKKIKIELNLDLQDEVKIGMDQVKFDTILQNLLSNALLYSKQAEGKISIQTLEADDKVKIIISDNGIGIPKDEIKHIFSRFYRASNALLVHPNGNGLGLYVVKSYVEGHGGEVQLKSEENKGTIIELSIPIKK